MIGNKQTKAMSAGRQGFTLVELIVGLAVFSLGIVIAVGLLMTALRAQRRSIAIQNVQDNARYLIGFMAKEIRMSEIKTLDGETAILDIAHPIYGNIRYSFAGTQIKRNDQAMSSDEVEINGRFYVDGKTAGDNQQPRVVTVMEVETTGAKHEEQSKINLQTTLSQRNIE